MAITVDDLAVIAFLAKHGKSRVVRCLGYARPERVPVERPAKDETAIAKAKRECQRLGKGITSDHIAAHVDVSLLRASSMLARLRDRKLLRLTELKKSAKGGRRLHVWEWIG